MEEQQPLRSEPDLIQKRPDVIRAPGAAATPFDMMAIIFLASDHRHDAGSGFSPEEAARGPGLGLTSMKERLKAVDGQLLIDSKPQRGTTVQARVWLGEG